MNFLAHIYLAGNNEGLVIGNFIADHIKGNAFTELPAPVQRGVILHRKIDAFTDSHPVVLKSKERLRPRFHKYAPVVADVFYDHFLAANWSRYSDVSLQEFAAGFYDLALRYENIFPVRTRHMFDFMRKQNWLVSYATIAGVDRALSGMARRAQFLSGMEEGADELRRNYNSYQNEFIVFFEDLQSFVEDEIKNSPE